MTEAYNKDGVTVSLVDNEAVIIYLEGRLALELTLVEWKQINVALEGLGNE